MTPIELSDGGLRQNAVVTNNNVMDHSTNYNFFITGGVAGTDPTPLDLIQGQNLFKKQAGGK